MTESLNLVDIVTSLDKHEEIHLARLLLLLRAFSNPNGPAIVGITKLAKLDFLLRYPSYFERALRARNAKEKNVTIEPYERKTIESQMVRYRFGPWDHRYRKFLNILAAKSLAALNVEKRTVLIDITEAGKHLADHMIATQEFGVIFDRAKLLAKHFNIGATKIMEFIYEQFPEIGNLEYNEEILPIGEQNEVIH